MKVQDLLDKPERWVKGRMAANKDGKSVDLVSYPEQAYSYCLVGALYVCYPDLDQRAAIIARIKRENNMKDIIFWQDAPERTFTDIKALVEKMDL